MHLSKILSATMAALSPWGACAFGSAPEAEQVTAVGVSSAKADGKMPLAALNGIEVGDVSRYDCTYEYKVDAGLGETYATMLQIGENISKFSDYTSYCIDSISAAPVKDEGAIKEMTKKRMNSTYFFDCAVWQNSPEGKITVVQEVVPHMMGYEEPMEQIEWTLCDESADTICGYACGKATARYGGREWTAWYAPEIPVSAGPWKLHGLPGLILAAKDSDGLHTFNAISFREGGTPILMPDRLNVHFSTRDKVIKRKADVEQRGLDSIDPSMIESITVMKNATDGTNLIINGVAWRERPNGYTPLETE